MIICDMLFHPFSEISLTSMSCFSVPDVSITTFLNNLGVKFTTDFYRLLRGFLSLNLGDPLVPAPETIPIEVLQEPAELYVSVWL